ncbi:hypothetical protein GCM10023085_27020 [Actinomadura viridis]|uniref:Uncharacterized protein n=1 Tax=Actinomadura viridis TaxID=58110 RepID=A0A931DGY5_9ACTN|nr:hypothetical protein [Actinomadura viridis]MBG6087311.1 hypothetical protein [Actinomadura viridis]
MDERTPSGTEIRIVGAELADGLELRTRGLEGHGLPELRVSGLAPYLGQGWARVLAALARRLVELDGAVPAEVDLGPEVTIGLSAEEGHLVPGPPRGFTGPVEEWRRDVLLALFPSART